MKISRVGIAGPYNALLRSPVMAQRMYDLLDYLRWHSSVPTRLNEFAILDRAFGRPPQTLRSEGGPKASYFISDQPLTPEEWEAKYCTGN